MIDTLLSLIAPHPCLSCGQLGAILCAYCKSYIVRRFSVECIACGAKSTVGICPKHTSPFQNAWYVGYRKGALQRLVGTYKFNGAKIAANTLAALLDHCIPELSSTTVVVWVPTHTRRIRERGYDHMAHLAKRFAKLRSLPAVDLFERAKYYVQHNSSRTERIQQVKEAMSLKMSVSSEVNYLLLDDIYTTGATIHEAARILRQSGAKSVQVAIIAKQPLD